MPADRAVIARTASSDVGGRAARQARIVDTLAGRAVRSQAELAAQLGLSQTAVRAHLRSEMLDPESPYQQILWENFPSKKGPRPHRRQPAAGPAV